MQLQLDLFGGETYDAARDAGRLTSQLARVQSVMSDGNWHSLRELADRCGGSEAAISARIRDFRKPKFGGHTVKRRNLGNGFWQYRLVVA